MPQGPDLPTGAPQEHPLPEAPSPPAEADVAVRVTYDVRGDGSVVMRWGVDARNALPTPVSPPLFQCAPLSFCRLCYIHDRLFVTSVSKKVHKHCH